MSCSLFNDLFAGNKEINKEKHTYIFHTGLASPIKEILETRIQEAFRRLNLKAVVALNPSAQRALMLANDSGDGDASRVPNIKEIAPKNTNNLIIITEPIIVLKLTVYTKGLSFSVNGWNSLKAYHNGARFGAKILEKNIPGKRTFLSSTEQLVQMLNLKRIDTMVEWDLRAEHVIRNLKISGIKKLSPPIKLQPFHIYLHKKHKALIPKLTKAIRQMKKEGFFNQTKREFVFYTGTISPVKDIVEARLKEAFKRAGGFKIKVINPGSAQRALVMANSEGDGDITRVLDIKKIAPDETGNLIQIPESINSIQFYVYTKNKVLSVDGYSSLAKFSNGFRVGTKILEKNMLGRVIMLPNTSRLFKMLNDGRLDNVIEWGAIADSLIKKNEYSGIRKLVSPLVDLPVYSLVHKKHQSLVPKIAKAIKEMKADGTFQKIEKDVLSKLNSN